ncbi:MmgE/PrpD family protein [Anaerobacillus sp. MEB173]|uniref:MmgE/PrpD family protein n=1 Tax=Anaerobacillus sp. MEB173 TaxID=3383345 RepID=UPI003F924787
MGGGLFLTFQNRLSQYAYQFKLSHVEQDTINRAKLIILDSITAIVHGNQTKEVYDLALKLSSKGKSNNSNLVSIYGTSLYAERHLSALINGVGMVSEELDEGNPLAKGHPSCHFTPALLACADSQQMNGKIFLESFIVGYELGSRVGSAIKLKKSIHPHGNWGIVGAAFALGKAHNFTPDEYSKAISLSGSLAQISLWKPVLEGCRIRDVYIGLNNLNAWLLPSLVSAGYSSSPEVINDVFTSVLGDEFNEEKVVSQLGETYFLMDTYFKFYPFCRFCHAPIDAMRQLLQNESITSVESIDRIRVHTYSLASILDNQNVNNEFAGKFSIPFSLATTIVNTIHPDVTPEENITRLAEKIEVYEDSNLTALLPAQRVARVELLLKDGKTLTNTTYSTKGDAKEENLEVKVVRKCEQMLAEVIGTTNAAELIKQVMEIETVDSLSEIMKLTKLN